MLKDYFCVTALKRPILHQRL